MWNNKTTKQNNKTTRQQDNKTEGWERKFIRHTSRMPIPFKQANLDALQNAIGSEIYMKHKSENQNDVDNYQAYKLVALRMVSGNNKVEVELLDPRFPDRGPDTWIFFHREGEKGKIESILDDGDRIYLYVKRHNTPSSFSWGGRRTTRRRSSRTRRSRRSTRRN